MGIRKDSCRFIYRNKNLSLDVVQVCNLIYKYKVNAFYSVNLKLCTVWETGESWNSAL